MKSGLGRNGTNLRIRNYGTFTALTGWCLSLDGQMDGWMLLLLRLTGQKEDGVITSSMKIIMQWVGFTKWFALLLNAALKVHVDKTSSKVRALSLNSCMNLLLFYFMLSYTSGDNGDPRAAIITLWPRPLKIVDNLYLFLYEMNC